MQARLSADTSQRYAGDIFYIFCTYRTTLLLRPIVPMVLLFPVYSIVMGTVMLGPWVLGHECGHGAFAPHKPCVKIAGKTLDMNDAVGFVLHSALLVPFWSWQYSHNKHHKYTNHLVLGETHVPNLEGHPVVGDTFPLLRVIGMHMGFPAYLLGFSRAKTQADLKTPMDRSKWGDHFHSGTRPSDSPTRPHPFAALTLPMCSSGCAPSIAMFTGVAVRLRRLADHAG